MFLKSRNMSFTKFKTKLCDFQQNEIAELFLWKRICPLFLILSAYLSISCSEAASCFAFYGKHYPS